MTRKEAMLALSQGHKITHKYFLPTEFVVMINNVMQDEQGIIFDPAIFWGWRMSEYWDNGWSIYIE